MAGAALQFAGCGLLIGAAVVLFGLPGGLVSGGALAFAAGYVLERGS